VILLAPAAAAVVAQAAQFDAYAYREAQPAAFAAELERLRTAWRDGPVFLEGERLALMMLAQTARSDADYRRAVAELTGYRAGVRKDVEDALAGNFRTEWLNGRWLNSAARTRDRDAQELFRRVFADQYQLTREAPASLGQAGEARLSADVRALAAANAEWLKSVLARIGWFGIGRYGAEASQAAWLIVQHSDHDPAWQREVLEMLRPRVARGDMQASYFAYLVDRVAVNAGEPQTYGTQGRCLGPGDWQPRDLVDPGNLDRRRAEVGLGPIADYRARFTCEGAH
jgi:hypothetical protein